MQISVNPVITTNASGTFSTDSEGYIQGTALNDPAVRNELAGGILSADAVNPMWGGVAIYELVPGPVTQTSPNKSLGGVVDLATAIGGAAPITGFTVFDQDHSMVNSPQSPVPLAGQTMGVNFYRLGSNARIAVAMDPVLLDAEGNLITQQVSWDFVNQRLIPYNAAYADNIITNAVYAAPNITLTTTSAHGLSVGSVFTISGFTPAGYNGTFTALAGTAGSTIVYAVAADPGADTVQGQLDAGGGAVPCQVLDVQSGNSMTVDYDSVTGFATWDRQGSCAVILI